MKKDNGGRENNGASEEEEEEIGREKGHGKVARWHARPPRGATTAEVVERQQERRKRLGQWCQSSQPAGQRSILLSPPASFLPDSPSEMRPQWRKGAVADRLCPVALFHNIAIL